MKDEALKLALEAFGEIEWSNNSQWQSDRAKVAIAAIKEALAQPEQELVNEIQIVQGIPFFTPPKQCSWVGLTQEEVEDSYNSDYKAQTRAIEAKLKEKNNG